MDLERSPGLVDAYGGDDFGYVSQRSMTATKTDPDAGARGVSLIVVADALRLLNGHRVEAGPLGVEPECEQVAKDALERGD